MLMRILSLIFALLVLGIAPAAGTATEKINLGRFSWRELGQLLESSSSIAVPGERLVALSRPFLETPYIPHTLVGGPDTEEQLVIDLAGLDCFTFLDILEALRRSRSVSDIPASLRQVRYRNGVVAYTNRRHFFSDWVAEEDAVIADVTALVGQGKEKAVVKQLNRKADGSLWLAGIKVTERRVRYLPTGALDGELLSRLHPGDYLGIYSEREGLDVSHVGLLVRGEGRWMLRHASSRTGVRRVVDSDLIEYLRGKPGLVVYRLRQVPCLVSPRRALGPGS